MESMFSLTTHRLVKSFCFSSPVMSHGLFSLRHFPRNCSLPSPHLILIWLSGQWFSMKRVSLPDTRTFYLPKILENGTSAFEGLFKRVVRYYTVTLQKADVINIAFSCDKSPNSVDRQPLFLPQFQFPWSQNDGGARMGVVIVLNKKWLINFFLHLGRDSEIESWLSGKVLIWFSGNNSNFLSILWKSLF